MTDTLRIKRRTSGAPGAPGALLNGEIAFNEMDNILYYGKAGSIISIAGTGAFLPLTGGTLTGNLNVSGIGTFNNYINVTGTSTSSTFAGSALAVSSAATGSFGAGNNTATNIQLYINGASGAGTARGFFIKTAGVNRWNMAADNGAESTGNAGSNFAIYAYADDGSFINTALSIRRSDMLSTFVGNLWVGWNYSASNSSPALNARNGSYAIYLTPRITAGAYNGIFQDSDQVIMSTGNAAISTGVLTLSVWHNVALGIRISAVTNTVTIIGNSGINLTGLTSFNNGIAFGSTVAANQVDFSKHINLYGGTYGFSVTSDPALNYVVAASSTHKFWSGGLLIGWLDQNGITTNGLPVNINGSYLYISNTTHGFRFDPWGGGYNPIANSGDHSIIAIGAAKSAGNLTLTIWGDNPLGIRINGASDTINLTANNAITLSNLSVTSGLIGTGSTGNTPLIFKATPNGTNTPVEGMRLAPDMTVLIGKTTSTGTVDLEVAGGAIFAGGMTVDGINFGSQVSASKIDLSKHIALYGTTHGFSITGSRINYVVPSGNTHIFVVNGVDVVTIGGSTLTLINDPTNALDAATKRYADTKFPIVQIGNVNYDLDTIGGTGPSGPFTSAFGLYQITNQTTPGHFPGGNNTGLVLHGWNSNPGWQSQLFMGASWEIWYRGMNTQGGYAAWARIVTTANPATVTGSRGGNAALASLLTTLAAKGLIVDGTTA